MCYKGNTVTGNGDLRIIFVDSLNLCKTMGSRLYGKREGRSLTKSTKSYPGFVIIYIKLRSSLRLFVGTNF